MENNSNPTILDFIDFMKGKPDDESYDVDRACLNHELFKDADYVRNVLPLYYFPTRNPHGRIPIAELKKRFKVGAELIKRIPKAIDEKKTTRCTLQKTGEPHQR